MNIERGGSRDKNYTVPPTIHPDMTSRQKADPLGHANEAAAPPDASSPLPTDPTILGKRLTEPTVHPSMRGRGGGDGSPGPSLRDGHATSDEEFRETATASSRRAAFVRAVRRR
jgi:hypothetical protein